MSLAARCPACGTVFRVVQDQLRVSEGWVRCGRCAEVFNAIESLVDLEAAPVYRTPERNLADERGVDGVEGRSQGVAQPSPPAPAQRLPQAMPDAPASRFHESRLPEAEPYPAAAERSASTEHTDAGGSVDPPIEPGERPTFVRRAEQAARWRRPGVRAALGTLLLLTSTALLAQCLLEYRQVAAARGPELRPFLQQACQWSGCRVGAPRMIDALAVESSGLVRIEGTGLYRLSVVLRSRSSLALAPPALDLTLTDGDGRILARRVIEAKEMGERRAEIPGLAELPLQVTLSAGERPISGYTIELFYP